MLKALTFLGCGAMALWMSAAVPAVATDDLLNNAASPDTGGTSFSIQTDKDTSQVWFQAHRFEATENGDVTAITIKLEVNSSQQNAAAAATYVQLFSNSDDDELDSTLANFSYDRHSLVSTTGIRDDINVTYSGSVSLSSGTYWLATFSSGDRDTDRQSASLSYSSLADQVYEGPWRWISGEQNRYSQTVISGYSTWPRAPLVTILGTRTNPPISPGPSREPFGDTAILEFRILLALPIGLSCDVPATSQRGIRWTQLPAHNECEIGDAAGVAVPLLLGWSTNPDFPIDIAQRQVENDWGAYETFNSDGQLTGVFIPAGGYTDVSSDTILYPIFSD